MNTKRLKFIIPAVLLVILVSLICWIIWGNEALELNTYTIVSAKLSESFDGYRIVHVSDLHNAEIGNGNEKLINMISSAEPDIIVITGDIIDSRNTNVDIAFDFILKAVDIAPCYYVTGNHEARIDEYADLKAKMISAGVYIIDDDCKSIEIGGDSIALIGVNDPSFQTNYLTGDSASVMSSKLSEIDWDKDTFSVLLSHRPELFDLYVKNDVDLIFSGHAHGGQFRLPLIGGLVAPNQGIFPEYDSGVYTEGNTNMVVSRGVGNSIFPFRVNNRPEIILIELKSQ